MKLLAALALVWTHWLADFVCQTDKMATKKSSSNLWLGIHVAIYSAYLLAWGWKFSMINGLAHFCTDWASSRVTSRLWKQGRRHDFFVVIGLDQAVHISTLLITWTYLR